MASSEKRTTRQADLVAAARAATRWAHARRATWTTAPLPVFAAPAAVPAPAPPKLEAEKPSGPSAGARAAARIGAIATPALRRLPRIAAMTALVAGGVAGGIFGGRYVMTMFKDWQSRPAAVKPVAPAPQTPARPVRTTGTLRVSSTPAGAQVFVDGKPRGVTPLTIDDLSAGRHAIELRSDSGTIQRTVTVTANATAEIDESIFSGWVAIFAPFDLVATEGGRVLSLDERNHIMLPPGRHELRLVNQPLGYDEVHQVNLKPGETARLSVKPPPSSVTVTATEPAEVWIDGVRIGDTPVNAAPAALGTHEIVVRRANGTVRRFTVTVTMSPFVLNVDF